MNCTRVRETAALYHYGELAPEEEEMLEAHCAGCADCTRYIGLQRNLALAFDAVELEPSPSLLVECRDSLSRHIAKAAAPSQVPWWRSLQWNVDFRSATAAVVLLAAGWFSGRFANRPELSQAGLTSLVRSVEPEASGRVQIAVDDVQRRIVSGSVEDREVRALLLAGVREESSPGVRVEAVDMLKAMAPTADVRAALLEAMERDPDPGVRLRALQGLTRFAKETPVQKAIASVMLSDANTGVRLEAVNLLTLHSDGNTVGILQNMVRKENDGYVRFRLQRALLDMNASVGTF